MEPRFRLPSSPVAHPDAVLQGDRWRITVLADGLVRIEWSEDGGFEDRASTFALHRDLPVPRFEVLDEPGGLEILTDRLHLTYDRGPFTSSGLSVEPRGKVTDWHSVWRFGIPTPNLGGTARTLDDVDGRTPLEPGVLSQVGVTALDDSASFLFEQDGWVGSRRPGRLDVYVFCYGRDHAAALRALYAVSGPQPVLPRWALGNWWSRYHRYSADEYLALLDRFDAERVPFSVAVLDMDWHRVDDVPPQYGSGWTGYSWNRDLFPDPPGFLAALHERGLRVTLNVHPADGVRPFEDAYPAMAEAVGRDPASDLAIPFDVTDQRFLGAYFEVLHHPLEDEGVDFWWLDWQQGHHSRLPGVDPLWMLNHFHFLDSGRDGRRPLTFSRYAGPGSHRYPVGFSGDAIITWASLAFQPEFTATASNIGYGWWSHDIGGHLYGVRDDELATRWVQFGVFTPILRLHSSNNPFLVKEPWNYPAESRSAMDEALRLRHRLVPYLHSMNHRAATEGVPLVRPMYHAWPDDERAYRVPNEYAFGSELLVAPITAPRDAVTLRGSVLAWLPPGIWTDLVTGTVYDGDRMVELHRGSASIPVLMKAGGILPLAGEDALDATRNPEELEVVVAPGADGRFVLVEDDGSGSTPEGIPTARTPITWSHASRTLRIGPVEGDPAVLPASRSWSVVLLGAPDVTGATVAGDALDLEHDGPGRIRVALPAPPAGGTLEVVFDGDASPRTAAVDEAVVDLLNAAQYGNEAKLALHRVLTADRPAAARLAEVRALGAPDALFGALAELVTARA